MGLPIKRFIAANNANDIFYKYLKTGEYNPSHLYRLLPMPWMLVTLQILLEFMIYSMVATKILQAD